jgi:probable HAF family extracellular repeat protein
MRGLGILGGNLYSVGLGINEAGTVVGYNGPFDFHAFAYDSAAGMRDLGSFGMTRNWARDINNRDQIVGGPYDASGSGPLHAFVYEGGQMRDLGVLPGNTFSIAYSINDSGDIVGYASVDRESAPARRSLAGRRGALTDLNS